MKDQYVGDIGDYGKYALLRALVKDNSYPSLWINWYMTHNDDPDDKNKHDDGKFIKYLESKPDSSEYKSFQKLDEELFEKLRTHLCSPCGKVSDEKRKISTIEDNEILHNATFFNDMLDYRKKNATEREACRLNWFNHSLEALKEIEQPGIIFLDPDNGLDPNTNIEIKSSTPTKEKGNKYVTYCEAQQYYEKAKVALVIYNHRDRSSDGRYIKRFSRFCIMKETQDAFVYRLTFHKGTARDYIFVVKPDYSTYIDEFLRKFVLHPSRSEYFSMGGLPMPMTRLKAFV